jgi:hypothetical protein
MSPPTRDPEAQANIDEFQQRITQRGNFYRSRFAAIYEDRVRRDLENLNQPPAPPAPSKPLLRRAAHRAAHAGKRAGRWVVERFSVAKQHDGPEGSGAEVIEGSYRVISDDIAAENTCPQESVAAGTTNTSSGQPDTMKIIFDKHFDKKKEDNRWQL